MSRAGESAWGEMRTEYNILVRKAERKRPLEG
jgi:hypothetical protein